MRKEIKKERERKSNRRNSDNTLAVKPLKNVLNKLQKATTNYNSNNNKLKQLQQTKKKLNETKFKIELLAHL